MLADTRFNGITIVLQIIYKSHWVYAFHHKMYLPKSGFYSRVIRPCLTTVFYNRTYNIAIPVDLARKQLVFALFKLPHNFIAALLVSNEPAFTR